MIVAGNEFVIVVAILKNVGVKSALEGNKWVSTIEVVGD